MNENTRHSPEFGTPSEGSQQHSTPTPPQGASEHTNARPADLGSNPYAQFGNQPQQHDWGATSTTDFPEQRPELRPQQQPVQQPAQESWEQQSWEQPAADQASFATSQGQPPLQSEQPHATKRKVGLGTALALMLAASVGTGVVTAVALDQMSPKAPVYNSLEQKPTKRESSAPAGSVEDVAQRVLPAVVSIQVSSRSGSGEGSGSIISSDGLVLTNNHVVGDAAKGGVIEVSLNDGSIHPAELIAGDGSTDIAVIKIKNVSGLPTLNFGDSNEVTVGQEVVAIGSPLGLSATVTSGIVSALNRPVRASGGGGGESSLIDAIQTDAAINPGNSGGPLVDRNGNLIGMNSVIATLSQGQSSGQSGSIGLGFAIPANQAKRIADQLVKTGHVKQPMIGVKVSQNSKYRGALIAGVDANGPAGKAGITEGDLITKVGNRTIDTADALIAAVRSREFGETITLQVTNPQSKETKDVKVTLSDQ